MAADPKAFGGNPSPKPFRKKNREDFWRVSRKTAHRGLQYSTTEGYQPLRDRLTAYLKENTISGGNSTISDYVRGAAVMELAAKVLCNRGRHYSEAPIALSPQLFAFLGKSVGVPMRTTMNMEALGQALKPITESNSSAIPNFQNPSGITMSMENGAGCTSLPKATGVIIVEDNPWRFEV